jgi:glycosyltransferase involved in cell wall biosynthesis
LSLGGILSLSDRLPRITVVTPSLNQGEFIRQTVDSVVSQGYPELDYWIIDGGSSDGTLSILQSYQNALRYISEPDAGQAAAVNKGLHRATGDVIGWLNSDDMYLPGALETVGIFFRDHPDTAVLYGDAYYCDDSGKILEPYPTRDFDWESFSSECYVCQPSVFFRRRVLEDVGVLDPALHFSMDYDFWIRVFRLHPPRRIRQFLSVSRMYSRNKTLSNRPAGLAETIRVVRHHYGRVPYKWAFAYASHLRHGNDQYYDRRAPTVADSLSALLWLAWFNRANPRYFLQCLAERFQALRSGAALKHSINERS